MQPFAAQPELLGDPVRRAVLGPDVDLDAVQPSHGQRVVDDDRERGGRDALSRVAAVDPVPGVGRAEGAAHDVADGEAADELALPAHGERPAGAVLDRAFEAAEHGAERGRGMRLVPGGARAGLPGGEPGLVRAAQLRPAPGVAAVERPYAHVAVAEVHGPAGVGKGHLFRSKNCASRDGVIGFDPAGARPPWTRRAPGWRSRRWSSGRWPRRVL